VHNASGLFLIGNGGNAMNIGFIGLGSVVETAYLPALSRLNLSIGSIVGFDCNPVRSLAGVTRCDSMDALLDKPLDMVLITTSSVSHLDVLERALASGMDRIVVEKPVCADLDQIARLKALLANQDHAARVLALDHWTARSTALRQGSVDASFRPAAGQDETLPFRLEDIVRIEGVLQEPSGFNQRGEPIALNFATGEPDTRQLRHPDGVIVDIGTHVLALLHETLVGLGGGGAIELHLDDAKDRLGRPIAPGDIETAEGEARLHGQLGAVPLSLVLNKYAGPAGGQKGMRLYLRDGRVISQDRRGNTEAIEVRDGERILSWSLPGPVYEHCLRGLLGEDGWRNVAELTSRRVAEVEALLRIHQDLRAAR